MAARSLLVVFALVASAVAAPIQQAAPRELQAVAAPATPYERAVNWVLCASPIAWASAALLSADSSAWLLGSLRSLLLRENAPSCEPEP